jgi:ribonuclease P/MRP protein subunit POP3
VFLSDQSHLSKRPIIPSGLQQSILTQLVSLFDGVGAYYQSVRNARKESGIAASSSHEQSENLVSEPNQELLRLSTPAPPIIPHITVGINEVTKALEKEFRSSRRTDIITSTADETRPLTRVVFICYADLDTPAFVAHLPQLVALCNSTRSEHHKIKVVQLPAGAQTPLANALGYLKRVSVIALDVRPCRLLLCLLTLVSGFGFWIGTPSCRRA